VAGRYFGRGFAAVTGAVEIGLAYAGVGGGTTISLSGIGAMIGIPAIAGSVALGGHGALVLVHVAAKQTLDPLPNIYFSSAEEDGNGGGNGNGNKNVGGTSKPPDYPQSEWDKRQQIVKEHGVLHNCLSCAIVFNTKTRDKMVFVRTQRFGIPLKVPNSPDQAAPMGWHVYNVDKYGYAWDNFGFRGDKILFKSDILRSNPAGQVFISDEYSDPVNILRILQGFAK
jgi:hypothetical protein